MNLACVPNTPVKAGVRFSNFSGDSFLGRVFVSLSNNVDALGIPKVGGAVGKLNPRFSTKVNG